MSYYKGIWNDTYEMLIEEGVSPFDAETIAFDRAQAMISAKMDAAEDARKEKRFSTSADWDF